MAAGVTQNFNEITHRLRQDTARLLLDVVGNVWSVTASPLQVAQFGGPQPVLRHVEIRIGVNNDIIMEWVVPNNPPPPDIRTYDISMIPHPTREQGELVYCDKVHDLVEEITKFVLRFQPDVPQMGEMIHECVTMLHQRLTQMEEKSII